MTKEYQFPTHVTIPTPMYTSMPRGVNARGPYALGPLGANMRVRVSKVDYQDIQAMAELLHMKPATFMRWCAVETVRALQETVDQD